MGLKEFDLRNVRLKTMPIIKILEFSYCQSFYRTFQMSTLPFYEEMTCYVQIINLIKLLLKTLFELLELRIDWKNLAKKSNTNKLA